MKVTILLLSRSRLRNLAELCEPGIVYTYRRNLFVSLIVRALLTFGLAVGGVLDWPCSLAVHDVSRCSYYLVLVPSIIVIEVNERHPCRVA